MFVCYKLQQSFCRAKECDCAKNSCYFIENHYLEQKTRKGGKNASVLIWKVGCSIKN
jgi:hypothetical protein